MIVMTTFLRSAVLCLIALALVSGVACAGQPWPSLMTYTLAVTTDEFSRYQLSLGFTGPISDKMSAKIEGWHIGGKGDDRTFVGDAYLDYKQKPLYLAAGRKYIPFGPLGVLVSPGLWGGEVKLDFDRFAFQALAGQLAFTPGTSTVRVNMVGSRTPSDEDVVAVRGALTLTEPDAAMPVKVGLNWTDVDDETGSSVDLEIGLNKELSIFGESASCGEEANAYGIRWSDAAKRSDGKVWIVSFYERNIDPGFVPASIGSSVYFQDQQGWAAGVYHQFSARNGFGVFADKNDAIFTLFGNVPLN
jgi:hypothetical protein